jgi:OmpA-OmpF porin, OOP family
MTPSLTPQPSTSSQQKPPQTSTGWGFLVFIFRLLLLGVGGSFAALAGVAIAQFHPAAKTQEPPIVEKVVQGGRALWSELEQVPTTLGLAPPTPQSPGAIASSPVASPALPSTPSLSEADKQKLQVELTQIQGELTKLRDLPQITEDERAKQASALEERIRALQQQLDPTGFAVPMVPPAGGVAPSSASGIPPATSRVSGRDTLLVTLPTDALFGRTQAGGQTSGDQTTLQPSSQAILDTILTDLQRYPGATIRVAAHSDNQGSEGSDRARTFEQATAVEQYLSGKLGKDYHWTVVGYGHSKPLLEDSTDVSRQRNRRIEVVIEPRR